MSQTFGQLNSTLTRALIKDGASQTQVGAFVTALEQVTDALKSEEAAALMQSGVTKTLFTKALSGAVSHNRSPARPETDPEQSALFGALEAIESLLKRRTDLDQPHLEDALLKAGVVTAAKPLLNIMINRLDDVECRETAVSCRASAVSRCSLLKEEAHEEAVRRIDTHSSTNRYYSSTGALSASASVPNRSRKCYIRPTSAC